MSDYQSRPTVGALAKKFPRMYFPDPVDRGLVALLMAENSDYFKIQPDASYFVAVLSFDQGLSDIVSGSRPAEHKVLNQLRVYAKFHSAVFKGSTSVNNRGQKEFGDAPLDDILTRKFYGQGNDGRGIIDEAAFSLNFAQFMESNGEITLARIGYARAAFYIARMVDDLAQMGQREPTYTDLKAAFDFNVGQSRGMLGKITLPNYRNMGKVAQGKGVA